jgi:hypothetical protein
LEKHSLEATSFDLVTPVEVVMIKLIDRVLGFHLVVTPIVYVSNLGVSHAPSLEICGFVEGLLESTVKILINVLGQAGRGQGIAFQADSLPFIAEIVPPKEVGVFLQSDHLSTGRLHDSIYKGPRDPLILNPGIHIVPYKVQIQGSIDKVTAPVCEKILDKIAAKQLIIALPTDQNQLAIKQPGHEITDRHVKIGQDVCSVKIGVFYDRFAAGNDSNAIFELGPGKLTQETDHNHGAVYAPTPHNAQGTI